MNEEEEQGTTLKEVFAVIAKRIWLVLGASVLIALIAGLVVMLLVNPRKSDYEIEFRIVYPAAETDKYPDGTPFYYRDLISEGTLGEVKASDERFANIDVEKMVDRDGVSIVMEETKTGDRTERVYKLSAGTRYFPDRETGNDFLKAVARIPENRVRASAGLVDFSLDEEEFSAASFDARLAQLADQKKALLAQYDGWIKLLGESYRNRETGRTLLSYRAALAGVFGAETQTSLERELEMGGYVPEASIEAERAALAQEYAINEAIIKEIKDVLAASPAGISTISSLAAISSEDSIIVTDTAEGLSEKLASCIARNQYIEHQLGAPEGDLESGFTWDATKGALNATAVKAYAAKVKAQFDGLATAAANAKAVSVAIYGQEASTLFETANVAEEGGTSTILVTAAVFVVVFAVGCVVAYFVAKYKKKPTPAADTPAAPETPETGKPETPDGADGNE